MKRLAFLLFCAPIAFTSNTNAQIRVMPLGDSITKGVSGPSTDNAGYRNDLAALLDGENISYDFVGRDSSGTGFDNNHEGHDGKRADFILSQINTILQSNPPDVVLLHVGTNDVSNGDPIASTRDEIANIIQAIADFDSDIKIVLSSLIPRTDGLDDETMALNTLLLEVLQSKRDSGVKIFYAGMNEIFKLNPDWKTDYFELPDPIHPTDLGFSIMAQVWFNAVMTAINADNVEVTDNFERSALGITWDAAPEFEIQNGELVNTATTGNNKWEYLATFRAVKNPTQVAIKWSDDADPEGIGRGGLALLLDSPTQDASGFLAWITPSSNPPNMLRLWTITGGVADQDLNLEVPSQAPVPKAGDVFRVNLSGNSETLQFDYYLNETFAGSITTPNPGVGAELYSGVLLRHDRNNNIAEFLAEGNGDFDPPDQVQDLTVDTYTATSAFLTWTATGDDGRIGRAARYDLRYSTEEILDEDDFEAATPAVGLPTPDVAGLPQSFPELDLFPNTTYYFALRVFDDGDNPSPVSNTVSIATDDGQLFADDFNRTELDDDWAAAPSLSISNDELNNSSPDQTRWDLAILTSHPNPTEVSFRWSQAADTVGIDQVGLAVMLDAPELTANGYLITRRTLKNEIRLWKIANGQNPTDPVAVTPLLAKPQPGDEFRVRVSSDQEGNHFTVLINGVKDTTLTDSTFFINPGSVANWYGGVMLAGGRNNNIDNFKVLTIDQPDSVDDSPPFPDEFRLSHAYPNPFNPETRIDYDLPKASRVKIAVFNILGQQVRTLFEGEQSRGHHFVTWDGRSDSGQEVSSGLYLIRMQASEFVATRRVVLLR